MSSAKSRKHYVLGEKSISLHEGTLSDFLIFAADLGFSAFWTFIYFIGFFYISTQWSKSAEPLNGVGSGNVYCAIFFSFLSIFTWAGCTWFAYLRYKAGVTEIPFQSTYESDPVNQAAYSSYPDANENEQYQEPPFSQPFHGQQFQAPTY